MKWRINFSIGAALAAVMVFTFGCKDTSSDPWSGSNSSNQAFMKVTEKSASVNSFKPNYNEEQAMTLAGTLGKDLYPIKIGQQMKLTNQSLTLVKDSTTATGTLVQKYDGTLIIVGSFQQPTIGINQHADTTIQKQFSTTITRMVKFQRIANTGNDTTDWKVAAVSLPNGGTDSSSVQITKITLTAQDGSTLVIDDPNAYFFNVGSDKESDNEGDDDNDYNEYHDGTTMAYGVNFGEHGHGWGKLLTWYKKNQHVKMSVEILSTSSDPDFLTITYGAKNNGNFRTKKKFDLVSSTLQGSYYQKVYEINWNTHSDHGRKHAVINVMPRSVVYDTNTSVQERSWGIPYRVK